VTCCSVVVAQLRASVRGAVSIIAALAAGLVPVAPALAGECPNEQLRSENSSTRLPDCRGYEQVTPAGLYNAEFNALSPDGGTVFWASGGGVAGLTPDTNIGSAYVRLFGTTRGTAGWAQSSSTNFSPESPAPYLFVGSTADGSAPFVISRTRESPENTYPVSFGSNIYSVRGNGQPLLVSHDEHGQPLVEEQTGLKGPVLVSGDGTHVAFSTDVPLTAIAAGTDGGPYVYEADAAGNVSLVSVMPDGRLPTPGAGAGLGSTPPAERAGQGVVANAVSANGATVFFNSSEQYDPAAPPGAGTQVFMHRAGSTIDVSNGTEGASFDGASSDGNKVVFSDTSGNIYEFDSATNTLAPVSSGAGNVHTFLTMSADGSHVYFASSLHLDPTAPPYVGDPLLYESAKGHVTYIATLTQQDVTRLTTPTVAKGEPEEDRTGTAALGPMRATPDGEHLVFESERPLTPDDANEEPGRTNVYEYTDGHGLVRVSQGSLPGSGNGPYNATIGSQQQLPDFGVNLGEATPFTFGTAQTDGRARTDSGAVFFSSREALAEGATDGPLHVYEWNEGNTYLISPAGADVADAHYLENSADGSDVYFSTTEAVLPSDTNRGWVNIWDARVDGGFPGLSLPGPCASNECPVSPPLARTTPPSTTFSGPGNPVPSLGAPSAQATSTAKRRPPTRAQNLSKALRACRSKQHNKRRRATCERRAKQQYGARSKPTKSVRRPR
jgi:Tol biopolymer transport system component